MGARRYCMRDPDAEIIDRILEEQITLRSRVIDLGCGDGRLLDKLRSEKQCSVLGVELDFQRVLETIERGVPVIQADLDEGLQQVPDDSFDFAVLSETLQQVRRPKGVLVEMLRIARRALVVVPNFGHWMIRLQVIRQGRAPVTQSLPYEWYNTPNLHFMSMHDFRDLADRLDIQIVKELPVINGRAVDRAWAANLRAGSAMYVLERSPGPFCLSF